MEDSSRARTNKKKRRRERPKEAIGQCESRSQEEGTAMGRI